MDMSPKPMRDRFKGGGGAGGKISKSRSFDTGTGAEVVKAASRRTNAASIKSAAPNNMSGRPGSAASLGGTSGMAVGRSVTAGPSYPGQTHGMGPKVTGGRGPTTPVQMGKTGGTDKSPKGTKGARGSSFAAGSSMKGKGGR